MLLAVDLGNTNTTLAVYDGETLIHQWRLSTRRDRTVDEHVVLVRSFLTPEGIATEDIRSAIVASVVPQLESRMTRVVELCFGCTPVFVTPDNAGVEVLYRDPLEVGADRLADAVAAVERYGGPVIVVDLGTATTFNVITARNEYLGGLIAPGVEVSAAALIERAAKLPRVEIKRPESLIGRSTADSLEAGFFWGYVSLVDGVIDRLRGELGADTPVVATGGWSRLIAEESDRISATEPDLTLEGLYLIARRLEIV